MKKVLIEIPDDHKRVIDNLVEDGKVYLLPHEVENRMALAIRNGKVLSEMTNGAVYEEVFDNFDNIEDVEVYARLRFEEDDWKDLRKNTFSKTWWNAPYEKRG